MVSLAKSGKRVVRLKGGDPMIFGRAGEEIAACRAAGIAVEVVPGISAAQGAASRLGLSLTHRKLARRVQYITAHGADGRLPRDIDWASLADPSTTTVVYMPKRTLAELAASAIARGLEPTTPAIAVVSATRPEQAVIRGTIADIPARLENAAPEGPVLVMIGRALAKHAATAIDAAPPATQQKPNRHPAKSRLRDWRGQLSHLQLQTEHKAAGTNFQVLNVAVSGTQEASMAMNDPERMQSPWRGRSATIGWHSW